MTRQKISKYIERSGDQFPEIVDEYINEKNHIILTHDFHKVNGLANLTYRKNISREIPPDFHIHKEIMEIHLLKRGVRSSFIIEGSRKATYSLTGGEVLIIFPNEPHANGGNEEDNCEYYAIQVDFGSDDDGFLGLSREYGSRLKEMLKSISNRCVSAPSSIVTLVEEGFKLISSGSETAIYAGTQYLTAFLFRLPNMEPVGHNKTKNECIQNAINYIENNYMKQIDRDTLAMIAGYSPSRFNAKFVEEIKTTPTNYINKCRVERAKEMLRDNDDSITDISFLLGFASSSYFSSVFKKYVGVYPLKYRNDCSNWNSDKE